MVILRDIRERLVAQEEAKRYAAVLATTNDAVILTDNRNLVQVWNPAAERMYGWSREVAIGMSADRWVPAEYAGQIAGVLRDATAGEPVAGVRLQHRFADGTIADVSMTATAVRDNTGRVVGISQIVRDISDEAEAARHEALLREQLAESNEDLQKYAYIASHDLQAPLRRITAFSELLVDDVAAGDTEQTAETLGLITRNVERMQVLIRDLLDYSRIETRTQPNVPINLHVMVADVIDRLRLSIDATDAQVSSDIPDELTLVFDPSQFLQLMQNLVENALKYHDPSRRPVINVTAEQDSRETTIRVSDNGLGIDAEYQARIFDMFQQVADTEGTGIGLAIVRKIVQRQGGKVSLTSTLGKGTTFVVQLPTAATAPGTLEQEARVPAQEAKRAAEVR